MDLSQGGRGNWFFFKLAEALWDWFSNFLSKNFLDFIERWLLCFILEFAEMFIKWGREEVIHGGHTLSKLHIEPIIEDTG